MTSDREASLFISIASSLISLGHCTLWLGDPLDEYGDYLERFTEFFPGWKSYGILTIIPYETAVHSKGRLFE